MHLLYQFFHSLAFASLLFQSPAPITWVNTKSVLFASASSQYIDFGNNIQDEFNTPFSWSFYVKFVTYPSQSSLIAKIGGATTFRGYVIDVLAAGSIDFILSNNYGANYMYVHTASGTISGTSSFFFVVVTADGTGTAAGSHIYVNAVDKALTIVGNTLNATISTATTLTFGADNEGTLEDYFNGNMAQVCHWNVALSGANVTTLYNSGTPVNPRAQSFGANCNHFWPLGTPNDTIAASGILDRVGSVNGTPVNSPVISSTHP